jgi:hypothetical protein
MSLEKYSSPVVKTTVPPKSAVEIDKPCSFVEAPALGELGRVILTGLMGGLAARGLWRRGKADKSVEGEAGDEHSADETAGDARKQDVL